MRLFHYVKEQIEMTKNEAELDRLAIGGRLYDAFNVFKGKNIFDTKQKAIIHSSTDNTIVISEKELIDIFKLVNGHEECFNYDELHIRLVR